MSELSFDPDLVAHAETAGWRAYYDRRWPTMLRLMMQLSREQFHMPLLASLVAAYYTVQAGRHWIPGRAEREKTRYFLTRFYRQASTHSGLRFDPSQAGAAELAYWDIARRIKQGASRQEYVETMRMLHSIVFDITPKQAGESAELRVQANELVNEITAGIAQAPERNWTELEQRLRQCYRSIQREMAASSSPSRAAS